MIETIFNFVLQLVLHIPTSKEWKDWKSLIGEDVVVIKK